ncbi:MAG: tryptophan 7-halogenase, partial [Acidimicrobiia bacterium]|nr:tryptophan 7-halogenase [Acidimicrobiia bacterium]
MSDLDNEKIEASPAGDGLEVVIIGGGLCGLLTGMLLAGDGHDVLVLERDPAEPPAQATEAWHGWERRSIRQFHMGHFFLPRFRTELDAHLPRVIDALAEAGAISLNPIQSMPEELSGGWRDGDERFEALTGRRPVVEATVAGCAAATDRLTIRRGVTVAALVTSPITTADGASTVHVAGIETGDGEVIAADLVVDAAGRNSGLPRLLAAAGAKAPVDEADDSGFVYYGRTFRSDDGSTPPAFGGGLQAYGSISTLTLAADNGTWQIAIVASGRDATIRRARHEDAFEKLWRSYPLVAHWLDGEPLSDIEVMANLEDRIRRFVVDGVPVATGLAAVGDSWACTNPSVGRGASMALMHAVA